MKLASVELRRLALPLVTPFGTAHGATAVRDVLLVHVRGTGGEEGWGECAALADPTYSPEYTSGAVEVIRSHLLPLLAASAVSATEVARRLAPVKGHRMAKAALEMAILDAELRAADRSLAQHLGAVRTEVDAGVAVGLHRDLDRVVAEVADRVRDGYRRVKLKIAPGADVELVRAVREAFPSLALQADANAAYSLDDAATLARLDEFGLLLLEQPLAEDDLSGHAELARRLATPVCLDESIVSATSAADAIALGACAVVNVKPGRVGGYLEARKVHDVCAERGVPVWCGGMLETGLGRAANAALAGLPNFTLPGDLSASDRYYRRDVTEPHVLRDGRLAVPTGPGIGVSPLPEVLEETTTWTARADVEGADVVWRS